MSAPKNPHHGRDRPWVFRTYSGHSSASASNVLYRKNLRKGQTGLSVAFDLPTQTGVDSDHPLARGEVGKVGVPISHIDDMTALFEGIPLDRMNTSMTINAFPMHSRSVPPQVRWLPPMPARRVPFQISNPFVTLSQAAPRANEAIASDPSLS